MLEQYNGSYCTSGVAATYTYDRLYIEVNKGSGTATVKACLLEDDVVECSYSSAAYLTHRKLFYESSVSSGITDCIGVANLPHVYQAGNPKICASVSGIQSSGGKAIITEVT